MFGVISSADCRFSALCTPLHSTCKCKSGSHPVSCNISGCKLLFFFDKLCIFVCMCVCVCVCMQRQQVCSFVWKKHQTVLDPQCTFCVCVDLCGWVCQRMWVFYILQTFQAALLAFKNKKIKRRKYRTESLVCLLVISGWDVLYSAHRLFFWLHTGYQLAGTGAPQRIVPVSQTKGKVCLII